MRSLPDPPPSGTDPGLRARAETWRRSDGGLGGVVAVGLRNRVAVLSVGVSADGTVRAGQAVVGAAGFDAPPLELAGACGHFSPGARERLLLGLVDASPVELASALHRASSVPSPAQVPTWGRGRYDKPTRSRSGRDAPPPPRPDLDAAYSPGGTHLALRLRPFECIPVTAVPGTARHRDTGGDMEPFLPEFGSVPGMELVGLVEFIRPWVQAMAAAAHGHLPFLTARNAGDRTLSWYGAAGEAGRRRRQAGALYPALAGIIAAEPSVAAAVDAGEPFEASLADVLDGFPYPDRRAGFDRARLRRMRGAPPFPDMGRLARAVSVAAATDLPSVPSCPADWALFDANADRVGPAAADVGLGLPGLLAPGLPMEASWLVALSRGSDVASRCSATLVAPLLAGGPYLPGGRERAGHLLFAGLGILAIGKLGDRWHARETRFNAALPVPTDPEGAGWPALFAPFRHDGVEVSCVTGPAALRAEGMVGPDADGVPGLAHCVGGFGPQCHAGQSYVASVREGGRRLSTVEFQCLQGVPVVIQHHGAGNADAPPRAMAAVKALVDAVLAGSVRVDPEALKGRPPESYRDGVDWSDPANLAAAHAAWRPYLRGRARDGVDGLRCVLAAQATPAAGWSASGSRGLAQAP